MKTISAFEAKNKLSEVINAANGEPQIITNNGVEKAVVISIKEYKRLTDKKDSLNAFLLASPLHESDLDLTRSKDVGRTTLDFLEKAK